MCLLYICFGSARNDYFSDPFPGIQKTLQADFCDLPIINNDTKNEKKQPNPPKKKSLPPSSQAKQQAVGSYSVRWQNFSKELVPFIDQGGGGKQIQPLNVRMGSEVMLQNLCKPRMTSKQVGTYDLNAYNVYLPRGVSKYDGNIAKN